MNTKKTIAFFAIAMAVAFVASVGMASAAETTKPTVKKMLLLADLVTDAGTVTVSDDGTYINIRYDTKAKDGWELTAYQVYVSTDKAPTKSAPGRFPFKNDYVCPAATSITVQTIDSLGCDCNVTLYIAAHAVLQRDTLRVDADGNPIYEVESVWAEGTQIRKDKNWAMYFDVYIPCPEITVQKEMVSQITPSPGADVTFDITVNNIGVYNLETVNVVDTLPLEMSYVATGTSPRPDNAVENADGTWTITWNNVGPLKSRDSTTIRLVAHIADGATGTFTNKVTVTGTTAAGCEVISTAEAEVTVAEAPE